MPGWLAKGSYSSYYLTNLHRKDTINLNKFKFKNLSAGEFK